MQTQHVDDSAEPEGYCSARCSFSFFLQGLVGQGSARTETDFPPGDFMQQRPSNEMAAEIAEKLEHGAGENASQTTFDRG